MCPPWTAPPPPHSGDEVLVSLSDATGPRPRSGLPLPPPDAAPGQCSPSCAADAAAGRSQGRQRSGRSLTGGFCSPAARTARRELSISIKLRANH